MFVLFKSVLLTDFIIKYHCLYITYWQRKLKPIHLNINHCRHLAFEALSSVHTRAEYAAKNGRFLMKKTFLFIK